MKKEKGGDQSLKFLCILFSCKKNDLQNSTEIYIERSRALSSQNPHQECACLLAIQHCQCLWDLCSRPFPQSAFREHVLSKEETWREVMLFIIPCPILFRIFSNFRSVRLAKSFPLLESWCYLGLVALLHCGLVKVSLFLSLNLSVLRWNAESHIYISSSMTIYLQRILHWTGKECCSTKFKIFLKKKPEMEAM